MIAYIEGLQLVREYLYRGLFAPRLGVAIILSLATVPAKAVIKAKPYPWVRLHGEASGIQMDEKGRHLVFTDPKGYNLSFLHIKEKKIYRITRQKVDRSFFLTPDGFRVFYRELVKTENQKVVSVLKAYDIKSHKSVEVDRVEGLTGFLTFDPRDQRFQVMHAQGILSRMIHFPDERLARWQKAQRTEAGKWLATPKGMLWLTHSGFSMRRLEDDQNALQSYDLSPDGSAAVWATEAGQIYFSEMGGKPKKIGDGFDPRWHPVKPLVIFAGLRKVGDKIIGTDIRVANREGEGRWLTFSQSSRERWPLWLHHGKAVVYALEKTTDIYRLELLNQ